MQRLHGKCQLFCTTLSIVLKKKKRDFQNGTVAAVFTDFLQAAFGLCLFLS